jgi:hypothetical protein
MASCLAAHDSNISSLKAPHNLGEVRKAISPSGKIENHGWAQQPEERVMETWTDW